MEGEIEMIKTKMCFVFAAAAILVVPAFGKMKFDIVADRADNMYALGEEAVFSVQCKNEDGSAATNGIVRARLDNFGSKVIVPEEKFDLASASSFTVKGKLDSPGFLRLVLRGEENAAADWSVGYSPFWIKSAAKEPADFDEFWRNAKAKLESEVPLDMKMEKVAERSTKEFEFYRISFATFGRRVYGVLTVPTAASKDNRYPAVVSVPGAGFGAYSQNARGSKDHVYLFMTVFDWPPFLEAWQDHKDVYDKLSKECGEKYKCGYPFAGITAGIETCFYYPVILGINRAVDWLVKQEYVDNNRVRYTGTSQGGMFGLILTGLNKNILKADVHVPAGCDLLGSKADGRQAGWPQLLKNARNDEQREAISKWAPYFDAVNFARRITVPIRFDFGFSDTVCSPPSVWSAYNACCSPQKSIRGGIGMTHSVFGDFYEEGWKFLYANNKKEMEYATPESQGVDSRAISRFIDHCNREVKFMHSFVLVRHGKIIAEGAWKPFTFDRAHILYSHSKSFISTAIGMLVDDGVLDLDDRVVDLLPEFVKKEHPAQLERVRVRDLLTMNYGSDQDHRLRSDVSANWREIALGKEFVREPGRGFRYDSDATFLLAAIVEKKCGKKLMDFLGERLFDVIGTKKAWTTTSPEGIACGGWGMYMTTREIAAFGQLLLQNGRWGDRQALSSRWIKQATSFQTYSKAWKVLNNFYDGDWNCGYGFQFWQCRHGAYRADGAHGQYTIVMPDEDAVLSINASTRTMQHCLDLVWEVLKKGFASEPLPENDDARGELAKKLEALSLPVVEGAADSVKCGASLIKNHKIEGDSNWMKLSNAALSKNEGGWKLEFDCAAGRQTVDVGYNEWRLGEMKLRNETYEGLGMIVGVHPVAASGAWISDTVFRVLIHLVDGTDRVILTFDFTNPSAPILRLKVEGMNWINAKLPIK